MRTQELLIGREVWSSDGIMWRHIRNVSDEKKEREFKKIFIVTSGNWKIDFARDKQQVKERAVHRDPKIIPFEDILEQCSGDDLGGGKLVRNALLSMAFQIFEMESKRQKLQGSLNNIKNLSSQFAKAVAQL